MKKLISIFCVVAMLFSMAIVASADENNAITIDFVSQDADSAVYAINLKTNVNVNGFSAHIDGAAAVNAGATIAASTTIANAKAQWNAAQKMVLVTYTPTDGSILTGNVTLGTITITNITSEFALTRKAEDNRIKFKIEKKDPATGVVDSALSLFTFEPNVTVKPYVEPTPGPVDTTVYGAAIACAKEWTVAKNVNYSDTFQNVAVATATCPATATEAGFKFAKDSETPSETAAKFVVLDDAAISGEGDVEYTAVMYGVDYTAVTTIYAIPYYMPAAN